MSCKKNKCDFCSYNKDTYKDTIIYKQKGIIDTFKPITNNILEYVSMDNNTNYRHKVICTFNELKGNIISGIYQKDSHKLIEINSCSLQHELANNIIDTIVKLANKYKMSAYNEKTGYGLLRHAVIRVSSLNNDVLLTLVMGEKNFQGSSNFINILRKKHPEIKSVIFNHNNRDTSVVLGSYDKVAYGTGKIMDKLLNTKFLIGSKTFFQVNPIMTNKLYQSVIDLSNISNNDIVLDTYCGIGTITLIAAKYAKKVIGVESNKESIINAKKNAEINNINNVTFINDDATDYITKYKDKIDILIMDPTRHGATKEFMESILRLQPKKIIYVSCDYKTQYRDIKQIKHKYNIESIQGFDMFPYTEHTETVCVLRLK